MFLFKFLALISTVVGIAASTAEDHVSDEIDGARRLNHYKQRTVEDIVVKSRGLTTLESLLALEGVGLAPGGPLDGEGAFTLFAPTNHAFVRTFKAYPGLQDFLVANPDVLTQVLLYHVLGAEVLAQDIPHGTTTLTNTLLGEDEELTVYKKCWWGGWYCSIWLKDGTDVWTRVIGANYRAKNGVVHAIDKVLVPPSLAPTVEETFGR